MADSYIGSLTEDTSPVGTDIIEFEKDPGGTPASRKATLANVTKGLSNFTGDSGSGGAKGLVPAPGAGDAAAKKVLQADGSWGTLDEFVEDKIGAKVVAGTGVSVSYNDTTGETTVSNTDPGSGASVTDEHIQDVVGAMLADGDVDLTYDDAGNTETNVVRKASEDFALPGDISPSQLTANTDDWNPTGLSTASTIRFSTDASRNLTGLQGGADGRLLILHNIGSQNAVLKDESASSTAANRFALNADVTLGADQAALLQYDSTSSRWRLVAGPSASSGGGSIAPLVIESANVVAQRNSTNAQTFNFYRSFTDASNYTRLRVGWGIVGGTSLQIIAEKAGSGSNEPIALVSSNSLSNGQIVWDGARLYPSGNKTQDIGWPSGNWFNMIAADNLRAATKVSIDSGTKLTSTGTGSGNDNILKVAGDFRNGGMVTGGSETPSTITSDQNNFNGSVGSIFQRWASDASRNVTGLNMAGNIDGVFAVIVNVGSNNIVLKHQDTGSTAANRFLCSTGADITLAANDAADILYDGTTQRWRVFKR